MRAERDVDQALQTNQKSDVRDLISPIWQRRWLILASVVIATVASYVVSGSRHDRFRATARVLVQGSAVQDALGQQQPADLARDTADQAQLAISRAVAALVVTDLGLRESPEQLLEDVSSAPGLGTSFVGIAAERPSAAGAEQVANAFARQYLVQRSTTAIAEIDGVIQSQRRQLAAVAHGQANAPERAALRATISRLQTTRALVPTQARIVDQAVAPGRPFSPRPRRDALFALVISLLFAVALAFGLERFDRRLKRPEQAEAAYGLPLLATIPHVVQSHQSEGGARIAHELLEPFRWLRTNIDLASRERPLRTLLVTSAVEGEGKSTIVRNLALALVEAGRRVCAVEADLRQPALCEQFGLERPADGLTAVAIGERTVAEVELEVPVDHDGLALLRRIRAAGAGAATTTAGGDRPEGSAGCLVVIPSGIVPASPQAVLSALQPMLAELSERFDVVLIDTPPVLSTSDAVPLAGVADGVVLVARVGVSTTDDAGHLMSELRRVGGVRMLGVVVNDLRPEPGGYGHGYGYGYGHDARKSRRTRR